MKKTNIILFFLIPIVIYACDNQIFNNGNKNTPQEACFNFDNDTINFPLENTKWIFLGYFKTDNHKSECKPQGIREMYLEFRENNKLYAQSSCNVFRGDYSVQDSVSLDIYDLGSTFKECLNDTVMNWEFMYFEYLEGAIGYNIEGKKLTISSESNINLIFKGKG